MRRIGRGIRKEPGKMNKLEEKYFEHLLLQKSAGYIDWLQYEPIKLRLAKKTTYTPDFVIMRPDGAIEIHEVKGFWEDHARVKIKCAAEVFPFRFFAVQWVKGDWKFEEIGA